MCAVAMIKSFLILAFECLVFDAAKRREKSPSHTDIIKDQRDCLSSWMRRMRRGGGGEHVDELGVCVEVWWRGRVGVSNNPSTQDTT